MKALHDIDTAFFMSCLRGKVIVNWTESSELFESISTRILRGCCAWHEDGTCTIYLNADQILVSPTPFLQMWRTTIHEFVVSGR